MEDLGYLRSEILQFLFPKSIFEGVWTMFFVLMIFLAALLTRLIAPQAIGMDCCLS